MFACLSAVVLVVEWIISKEMHVTLWIIPCAGFIYVLPLILRTRYILLENEVIIKFGLANTRIAYKNIISITKTMKRGRAAGLSIIRVQIKYRKDADEKLILISPKNRDDFIRELSVRTNKH